MQAMTEPDIVCDLSRERWPFDDNSMEKGICSHVMEHLGPEPERLFHFLKELYRVSAPGAITRCVVPHPRHDIFINDPTHVRPIMPTTMMMFSKEQLRICAEQGTIYTPFADYLGVDFFVGPFYYVIDPNLPERMQRRVAKSLDRYERYYSNVIFEIQFPMRAVK
jgi:hypothetical protein